MSGRIATAKSSFVGQGKTAGVRIKSVALPIEHGGWGLSLEPVALGLLVAPSVPGVCLAAATVGVFLSRHPLKLVAADRARGRRFPRTPVAEKFVALYASVAALGLAGACLTADDLGFLWPVVLAAPLAAAQLIYDLKGRTRSLPPELAGACAMAAAAACIALAGGWGMVTAFGLWAVLAARVVPTILYVRARVRRLHGGEASSAAPVVAHVAALAAVSALAAAGIVPLLPAGVFLLLSARALVGLLGSQAGATAKRIGFTELGYGALLVACVAAGHRFGW
jgi:hypothetical protein